MDGWIALLLWRERREILPAETGTHLAKSQLFWGVVQQQPQ
jgi:hypothetical protein